jgi:hypothetical protein
MNVKQKQRTIKKLVYYSSLKYGHNGFFYNETFQNIQF